MSARILHIAAHMGDGAGKAIGGLAIADTVNRHRIFLLEAPRKMNHIENCAANHVPVIINGDINAEMAEAGVLILNWWGHPLTGAFIRDMPKPTCPVVLWMHKNGVYDPPLPDAYADIADAVMVTTPYSLAQERFKNAALVYGFGNFSPRSFPCKTDYARQTDEFVIGYVGSPSYKKLPLNFLDYCAAVIHAIPNARFVLIGEAGEKIKHDIALRGLTQYFKFYGWVENVKERLLTFDVFGYLLRYNTYATTENAVLEAMAAGLPVVMSETPLGKYFIEHYETGLLADSPQEYAAAMLSLYEDAGLRAELGKAARRYCAAHFNTERNIEAFNTVIRRLK